MHIILRSMATFKVPSSLAVLPPGTMPVRRPLVRPFGAVNDLFSTPRSLLQMLDVMGLVFDDPVITPMDLVVNQLRDIIRTPWDVKDEENACLLRVDLPGYSKDQVKVYVEEGSLVIKAGQAWKDNGDKSDMGDKSASEGKGDKFAFRN